jgi:hypothetical protein
MACDPAICCLTATTTRAAKLSPVLTTAAVDVMRLQHIPPPFTADAAAELAIHGKNLKRSDFPEIVL